jgi:hypothetical protein
MLIEPTEQLNELSLPAVSPQRQTIGFDRMDAKFGPLPRANCTRPDITVHAIGQQPELMESFRGDICTDAFGAIAGFDQCDVVGARFEVHMNAATWSRSDHGHCCTIAFEFQEHIREGDVVFITHITNQHRDTLPQTGIRRSLRR